MAISSAWSHRPHVTGRGKCSRHSSGRLRAGGDADLGRQVLDQHRHQVGGERSPTAAGSRTWRRRRCWSRSCPDRRRRRQATNAGPSIAQDAAHSARAPAAARRRSSAGRGSAAYGGVGRRASRSRPHGARQRAAEHVDVVAEADEDRAVERLLVDRPRSRRRARCRARPGSAASPGRSPRRARRCRTRRARASASALVGRSSMHAGRRVGIGSPCGSCVGLPSLAAISSSSSSESTCSSTSASSCTRSHGTPSDSAR